MEWRGGKMVAMRKYRNINRLISMLIVELFLFAQFSYVPPFSFRNDACRRVKDIPLTQEEVTSEGEGVMMLSQARDGVDYQLILDRDNNEATIVAETQDGKKVVVRSWFADEGKTLVRELRGEDSVEFQEWTLVETESGEKYLKLAYRATVQLNQKGNTQVVIYDNQGGGRLEEAIYKGRSVFDNVQAGRQLLKMGGNITGELIVRSRVEILSDSVYEVSFESAELPSGYTEHYEITPAEDGTYIVRKTTSDGYTAEWRYKKKVEVSEILNGFAPEEIVSGSLVVNGEKNYCPESSESLASVLDEYDYWARVEARETVTPPAGSGLIGSRVVRNVARAIAGAMVGTYAAAHLPLARLVEGGSELSIVGAHMALLFPMYVSLNKFAQQAILGMTTEPEKYDVPSDPEVLKYRFSDRGFKEGVGIFYTCKIEGADWARAIGLSIKGNAITPEDIKTGAIDPEVVETIKADLREKLGREPSDLDIARELNKNLYVVIVTDGDPSKEEFLEMVSLVHKLRQQYGKNIQILFSARREGERLGYKPGAYQDTIGLFTRGIGPRTYRDKIYTDRFLYGPFSRVPNSPIFGIYDPSFKQRALEYYKSKYHPTPSDLAIFEYELKQLEETGWISGYYGEQSTIVDLVRNHSIKHLFTLDSGNFIGVNQMTEMAAKVQTALNDPEYREKLGDVVMFEPQMEVTNPDASWLTNFFASTQRRFHWHDPVISRIRTYSQSAGKVWIIADRYADIAMKPGEELLDPWTVAHDWMESAVMRTVQLLGVYGYETRYVTFNETEEVPDETFLVGMSRFIKSNDMDLLRNVYARHSVYKYLMDKLGVDLKEIKLPDDPVMREQALEIFNDAAWFCRANDIFGTFLGLTWTLGALSSAFSQVQPLYSTALLATVLGVELMLLPQVLAPTVRSRREGVQDILENPTTPQEIAAKELRDRLEELMRAGEWTEEDLGGKTRWQKFEETKAGVIVSLVKNIAYALYDIARSNLFLMPLLPMQVGTRRANRVQIAKTALITQRIINLMRQGYTEESAIEKVATEIDTSFFKQLGFQPTTAMKNLLVKMLHYANINAGEVYHITSDDIRKVMSPGRIYRGYVPSKRFYRFYTYGITPVIGATLIGLPVLLGMGPVTLGLGAALGTPFALFPLVNYLTNRSARNMDYVRAIARVESDALGRDERIIRVGDALFFAHRDDNNYDYTARVRWMIEKGRNIENIWNNLTVLERLYLRAMFGDYTIDEIKTLTPAQLQEIDRRAKEALEFYLNRVREEFAKYRNPGGR